MDVLGKFQVELLLGRESLPNRSSPAVDRQVFVGIGSPVDGETSAHPFAVEQEVDETNAIPLPMKAGECLIFHCHMMHRSEGNLSTDRDRRVLFLRYADADAVEVYSDGKPRLGRLLRGKTRYPEVESFESDLSLGCRSA